MSEWKAKRFWDAATVAPMDDAFTVHLDGRPVRTPLKSPLWIPTEALAQAIADEWDAQDGMIKPETMAFTRSANAALDKVATQKDEVATLIAAYGGSDLLCYRADDPPELAERQAEKWDPLLKWAESDLFTCLNVSAGVMPCAQSDKALDNMDNLVRSQDVFALTALHDLVSLSGSLVLGLAAQRGVLPPDELWQLSRLDEDWQIERWGDDDEATATATLKKQAFLHAYRFYQLSRLA